jgi:LCP family protein required for cell wall assembly
MDDEPRHEGSEGSDAEHSGDVPASPPPATWAGRMSSDQKGPVGEDDEGLDTIDEPPDEELADLPDEDLDELNDDLDDDLDDDKLDDDELGGAASAQDTVEANTPELADREAAREAALAGLRARTAEHAAKRRAGVTPPPSAPPTPTPAATTKPADAGKPPQADGQAAPPTDGAPPPGVDAGEKPPRQGLWMRFVAGSLLIVVSMTAATAISLLLVLNGFLDGVRGLASVRNELTVANPGDPQIILLLGSDKRPKGQEIGARSDTTLLLRVASDQITMLSIPRDLKVNIPGHGIDKFNAAYTYGGPKLTVKVVKQLTGIENINHVVNVNFTGFADAVNAIGCVYVDVDHHYYHSNAGLAPTEQYAEIDIPAGYQRMCGLNALEYVRYRHDDNDLVRAARQQEFLRQARQELPAAEIAGDFNELKAIAEKYVTMDIRREIDLITLAKLFLSARSAPVLQIHFPADLGGPTASYVTASQGAIRDAVRKFLGEQPPPPAQAPPQPSGGGPKPGTKKKAAQQPPPPPLIDSTALGQQYAAKLASSKTKSGKPMLDFPVYYPTKLAPGSTLTDDSRAFPIDGPGSDVYHGYKMVAATTSDGYEAYYGVSGTDWMDPPILQNPDETKTINGQDYLESWDGDQLRLVGWKTDKASYWIDNTLLNVLSPGQMLGIAESMQKYTG